MKKLFIAVTILLSMLLILGCQPAAGPSPPTEAPSTEAAPASLTTTPSPAEVKKTTIGEEASNDQVAVTVHSVKFYDQITDGRGSTHRPPTVGQVFAVVDLTISNTSGFSLDISPTDVQLVDTEAKSWPRPILMIIGRPHELTMLKGELLPVGQTSTGMVVFAVEEGKLLDRVTYSVRRAPIEFKLAELEEEASNGLAAVTLHSVEFSEQITDTEGNMHKPFQEGNVFGTVDLTIKNVSQSVLEIGPQFVRLYDEQDKPYSQIVLLHYGWPYPIEELKRRELGPGEETRGLIVFSVENKETITSLSYTTPATSTIEISLEGLEVSVPPYRMPRIGETARGGGVEMRVTNVGSIEKLEKELGEESDLFKMVWTETAKEGYELVIVDLAIKNVSIEPKLTVNPLYVLLIDTESKAYGKVTITFLLEGQLGLSELSPGEETSGRLLFSVPAGTITDKLMYRIGALGPPVQVSLQK